MTIRTLTDRWRTFVLLLLLLLQMCNKLKLVRNLEEKQSQLRTTVYTTRIIQDIDRHNNYARRKANSCRLSEKASLGWQFTMGNYWSETSCHYLMTEAHISVYKTSLSVRTVVLNAMPRQLCIGYTCCNGNQLILEFPRVQDATFRSALFRARNCCVWTATLDDRIWEKIIRQDLSFWLHACGWSTNLGSDLRAKYFTAQL